MNTKMISAYNIARKTIGTLSEKIETATEECRREIHRLTYDVYQPKIRALEKELDEHKQALGEQFETKRVEMQKEIDTQKETVTAVERTLNFIRLADKGLDKELTVEAYYYNRSSLSPEKVFYEHLSPADGGVIVDSPYLKMYAYIVKNKKPTNCYSLIVVSSSAFSGQNVMEDLPWGYSNGLNTTGSIRILKEGPDEDKLLQWYKKNGLSQELKDYVERHKKAEQDYEEAKGLLKDPNWLRAYLEYMKDYYENHYSGGTKTPEYKAIMRRLSKLQ